MSNQRLKFVRQHTPAVAAMLGQIKAADLMDFLAGATELLGTANCRGTEYIMKNGARPEDYARHAEHMGAAMTMTALVEKILLPMLREDPRDDYVLGLARLAMAYVRSEVQAVDGKIGLVSR